MSVEQEWPDPIGFVTSDPPEWVGPQHGWKRNGKFYGKVRGTVPDNDHKRKRNDRHPDLPENAFALTSVSVTPPDLESKHHFPKRKLDHWPEGKWVVDLTYSQSTGSYSTRVWLYSTEFDSSPLKQTWTAGGYSWDERRRVEFFDSLDESVKFAEGETGLSIPNPD